MNKIDELHEANYTIVLTALRNFEPTTLQDKFEGLTLNRAVEVYEAAREAARQAALK